MIEDKGVDSSVPLRVIPPPPHRLRRWGGGGIKSLQKNHFEGRVFPSFELISCSKLLIDAVQARRRLDLATFLQF
jgi:hypothetical protein